MQIVYIILYFLSYRLFFLSAIILSFILYYIILYEHIHYIIKQNMNIFDFVKILVKRFNQNIFFNKCKFSIVNDLNNISTRKVN